MARDILCAGVIPITPKGKIVLASKDDVAWQLLKGKIEDGQSVLDAALLEAYQEGGQSNLILTDVHLGSYILPGKRRGTRKKVEMILCLTQQPEEVFIPEDDAYRTAAAFGFPLNGLRFRYDEERAFCRGIEKDLRRYAKWARDVLDAA